MQIIDDRLGSRNGLNMLGAMLSDPGKQRRTNEDHVAYVIPRPDEPSYPYGVLALVADGMGGHSAGEVASALAVDTIVRAYYATGASPSKALGKAFDVANHTIYTVARNRAEYRGMGTTCTALVIRDGAAYLAHIGDSRCYLLRGNKFRQLSEDHSKVMELVRKGTLTRRQAKERPDANVILRALGTHEKAHPVVWQKGLALRTGDVLLLCSDGLTDLVDDQTIKRILSGEGPLKTCRRLISAALKAGGYDNISVGVFRVSNESPSGDKAVRTTRRQNAIQVA
jgi:serine/threonine protein phosphatase PrpC